MRWGVEKSAIRTCKWPHKQPTPRTAPQHTEQTTQQTHGRNSTTQRAHTLAIARNVPTRARGVAGDCESGVLMCESNPNRLSAANGLDRKRPGPQMAWTGLQLYDDAMRLG